MAHLNAAEGYAKLSKANRLQVGAVLTKDDRIISVGYNGLPSGSSNVCEEVIDGQLVTKPGVCHAELNVIAFAARHGIPTEGTELVITHSPCYECCKLLIQAGVTQVWYWNEYRDKSGLEFLTDNKVAVFNIRKAGVYEQR